MRNIYYIFIFIGCISGCSLEDQATEKSSQSKVSQRITIAWISDKPVYLSEYNDWKKLNGRRKKLMGKNSHKKEMDRFLRYRMLVEKARDKHYHERKEIKRWVERRIVGLYLKEKLNDKIASSNPSDVDMRNYYRINKAKLARPEMRRMSVIFVRCGVGKDDCYKKAKAIQDSLTPLNFKLIARKMSDEPYSSRRGGDIGFTVDPSIRKSNRRIPDKVIQKGFSMKEKNVVSRMMKTEKGYYFILIKSIIKSVSPSFSSRKGLVRRLMKRERQKNMTAAFFKNLENTSSVRMNKDNISRYVK